MSFSLNIYVSIGLKSAEKNLTFNLRFLFKLSIVKSFEISPKHSVLLLLLMWYHLILVLVLHQELRYLFSYYQYAQMSSHQLQK